MNLYQALGTAALLLIFAWYVSKEIILRIECHLSKGSKASKAPKENEDTTVHDVSAAEQKPVYIPPSEIVQAAIDRVVTILSQPDVEYRVERVDRATSPIDDHRPSGDHRYYFSKTNNVGWEVVMMRPETSFHWWRLKSPEGKHFTIPKQYHHPVNRAWALTEQGKKHPCMRDKDASFLDELQKK